MTASGRAIFPGRSLSTDHFGSSGHVSFLALKTLVIVMLRAHICSLLESQDIFNGLRLARLKLMM